MKPTETQKTEGLINALKEAKSLQEIETIEVAKDAIIWMGVQDIVQDLWYETLGDAKKGLYF